jgi:hypothetical protein
MVSPNTADTRLDAWEQQFRAAAQADRYAALRAHLRRLELPSKPRVLLEGTIRVVRMCAAYATIDDRDQAFHRFLDRQRYDPSDAAGARYVFTFDLYDKAFARVLATTQDTVLDLADLYSSPWNDYEIVGFHRLWISRLNDTKLTRKDIRDLKREITDDLRFDYSEDEVAFWFDDTLSDDYLLVTVQDVNDEA